MWKQAKLTLGNDFLWWLLPTHPEIQVNYYESVWPKKQVKRMYKEGKFDMEEDDSDPDKKHFAKEQARASFEKKILILTVIALALLWVFVIQEMICDFFKWPSAPVLPGGKRGTPLIP